ncbi:hypothetical protein [Saccharothrix sp.]|uniref:YczE/YyaS/YitT family protein n=1 Tax=Saccharothrix sp. TaxID=1873460 RepID=UPI002810E91A|nr:hypothetical protein [Saccharothrix sp.]
MRVVTGAALMGGGVALVLKARLGLVPLDVLHAAVADRAGLTLGCGIVAVQAVLLLLWWPLRIRPGLATVVTAVLPGVACDAVLAVLPTAGTPAQRVTALATGGLLFALGVALYLGARLGANPRDGIIGHLAQRGHHPAAVRVALDLGCLTGGWLLIGPVHAIETGIVGAGSVVLALAFGPLISRLRRLIDPGLAGAHTHSGAPQSASGGQARR